MSQIVSQKLPSLGTGLTNYLTEIRKFPMLTQVEETTLGRRWRNHGDREAAIRLLTSHLLLVAKSAMGYGVYGLPLAIFISEGNVGLMRPCGDSIRSGAFAFPPMPCGGSKRQSG